MSTRRVKLLAEVKGNMNEELKKIKSSMKGLSTASALMAVAVFAASKSLAGFGTTLFDTSKQTGATVEEIQSLGYVLAQTGGEAESAGELLGTINLFMRDAALGSKEYTDALSTIGLSYDDIARKAPMEVFTALTDGIGGLTDATERNLVASTIFGENYSQVVVGALDQAEGSIQGMMDAFIASGDALSGEQIDILKDYDQTLTDLSYSGKKMMADVLLPLIPVFKENIEAMMPLVKDLMPDLVDVAGSVADGLGLFLELLTGGIKAVGGLKAALAILISGYITYKIVSIAANITTLAHNAQLTIQAYLMGKVSIASMGMKAAIGPTGLAAAVVFTTIQLVRLKGAMDDASEAARQNEEAVNRMSGTSARAGDIIYAVSQATDISRTSLEHFADQLERMDDGSEDVATAIAYVDRKLAELDRTAIEVAADLNTLESRMSGTSIGSVRLTADTNNLTVAMIRTELAAVDTAIANAMLMETMENGPSVIAGQISALREYRETLEGLGSVGRERYGVDDTGTTGSENIDDDPEALRLERLAEKEREIALAVKNEHEAAMQAEEALIMASLNRQQAKRLDIIKAEKTAALAAETERRDAEAATQQQAIDGIHAWGVDFGKAMMQGSAGAEAWGESMLAAIKSIIMEAGFAMIMNLIIPGGGKAAGGILGSLFSFSGGSSAIPAAASGISAMPMSNSVQGDKVLGLFNPGESILTPTQMQEVREQGGGGSSPQIIVNFSSVVTPSAAQKSELVPIVVNAMREAGVSI